MPNVFRKNRAKARMLLEQDGKCCYCGIRMRLVTLEAGEAPPPDQCTVEHLYPKGDPRRGSPFSRKLACYQCNNERGRDHARACVENGHSERQRQRTLLRNTLYSATDMTRWLATLCLVVMLLPACAVERGNTKIVVGCEKQAEGRWHCSGRRIISVKVVW